MLFFVQNFANLVGAAHKALTGGWNTVGQTSVSKFVERPPNQFQMEFTGDTDHLTPFRTGTRPF
jgi:hypothetical protein